MNNPAVKGIATKHGKTEGQVLIRYALQRNIMPITKTSQPHRINENRDVFGN